METVREPQPPYGSTVAPVSKKERERETLDAVQKLSRLNPLVRGHLFKRDSRRRSFHKRYFALYEGMLLYYTHERDFDKDKQREMVRNGYVPLFLPKFLQSLLKLGVQFLHCG